MRRLRYALTAAALLILSMSGMAREAYLMAVAFSIGETASLFCAELFFSGCAAETDEKKLQSKRCDALILMCIGCLVLYGINALLKDMPEYLVNCAAGYVISGLICAMLRLNPEAKLNSILLSLVYPLAITFARFSPYGYFRTATFIIVLACVASIPKSLLFQLDRPSGGLIRALPEAFLKRGIYVLPSAALCVLLNKICCIDTIGAWCAGLMVFGVISSETQLSASEKERAGAFTCLASAVLFAAVCAGLCGAWSGAYIAGAAICALLPAGIGGNIKRIPILVCEALCCMIPSPWNIVSAGVFFALTLICERRALYAVYIELHAFILRRRL